MVHLGQCGCLPSPFMGSKFVEGMAQIEVTQVEDKAEGVQRTVIYEKLCSSFCY